MGQALRRATSKLKTSPTLEPPPQPKPPGRVARKPVEVPPDPAGTGTGRDRLDASSGDGSHLQPSNDSNVLEERNLGYDAMLSKMVGRISTKPGGKLEMGEAFIVEKFNRPLPRVRSSQSDISKDDQKLPPGTLTVAQLKEILLLHQGKSEDHPGQMGANDIAKKFRIDAAQVQKILQFVSLPPEDVNKKQQQKQQ